jgi:hypothetical protein
MDYFCKHCNNVFQVKRRRTPFCSLECVLLYNSEPKPLDATECWKWTGPQIKTGHGFITAGTKMTASRAAYLTWKGPISSKLVVRHKCRTPSCINVDHLELGTRAENIRDKIRDGTTGKGVVRPHIIGSRNHVAKITEEQARQIFLMAGSLDDIANAMSVSAGIVYRIKQGVSWNHVTGLPRKKPDNY